MGREVHPSGQSRESTNVNPDALTMRSLHGQTFVANGQPRSLSLIEAASNVIVGYILAVMTQLLSLPLFGLHLPLATNLSIGAIFTAVSLARSYLLRRLFENIRLRTALL
jgi:hypothetical protein